MFYHSRAFFFANIPSFLMIAHPLLVPSAGGTSGGYGKGRRVAAFTTSLNVSLVPINHVIG